MGGQSERVPPQVAGVRHSGDSPQNSEYMTAHPGGMNHESPPPVPAEGAPLSHYKGISLRNIGRDPKTGKVIPHKRSTKVANLITAWIATGADANAICIRLNMRPGTLKQLYSTEIALAVAKVEMDVGAHILSRVKKSDRMAIFYAKAKMGWRDGDTKPIDTSILAITIHA